jgi:hypothetical protein
MGVGGHSRGTRAGLTWAALLCLGGPPQGPQLESLCSVPRHWHGTHGRSRCSRDWCVRRARGWRPRRHDLAGRRGVCTPCTADPRDRISVSAALNFKS